ncbi:MAG: ASKHA domain-containing protein [candidate division Zixibacteria bacterium]|nr:ASKHA domain-containing protein [candidate division Zixibacteria bacterium]
MLQGRETQSRRTSPPAHDTSPIESRSTADPVPPGSTLFESGDKGVVLTQQDIRQVQLAKAAIRAGIKVLEKSMGVKDADIKHVLLAGTFGNCIRSQSALRIGLLPDVPLERIKFVGGAASFGAEMILVKNAAKVTAGRLARRIAYVEIATDRDFQEMFAACMLF